MLTTTNLILETIFKEICVFHIQFTTIFICSNYIYDVKYVKTMKCMHYAVTQLFTNSNTASFLLNTNSNLFCYSDETA